MHEHPGNKFEVIFRTSRTPAKNQNTNVETNGECLRKVLSRREIQAEQNQAYEVRTSNNDKNTEKIPTRTQPGLQSVSDSRLGFSNFCHAFKDLQEDRDLAKSRSNGQNNYRKC